MAYAQPAYRIDSYAEFEHARRRSSISVERAGASQAERRASQLLVTAAAMAAIVLVVVAALAFARIALTNATVTTLIESDNLSGQIESARSSGIGLEMEQSVLSNTYAVNAAAKRLGMEAPTSIETISLAPDIVAVDANGALSLSESAKNLAKIQG